VTGNAGASVISDTNGSVVEDSDADAVDISISDLVESWSKVEAPALSPSPPSDDSWAVIVVIVDAGRSVVATVGSPVSFDVDSGRLLVALR
jgi:hypothetical protein